MKTLCFDIESTGLIPKQATYEMDYMLFPYPVQIAWVMVDSGKNVLIKNNHVIRPNGWVIPAESFEIHGIDNDTAKIIGVDMLTVFRHFVMDCEHADKIVGHNINGFDMPVVKACLLRLGIDSKNFEKQLAKEKRIDTMKQSTDYMKLTFKDTGGFKYPKLSELYFKLFNVSLSNAHNAMADVNATLRCYYRLIELGVIRIN